MKLKFTLMLFWAICIFSSVQAQVVYTEPFFPEVDDDVTVYFNADEGNGALVDFVGDIYAHTGVITSESTSPSDWKYVVSDWGTTDPNVLMTQVSGNLYQIEFNIQDYYGIPMSEEALQMAFVFRDAAGNTVGRAADGSDIFAPIYDLNGELETRFLNPTSSLVAEAGTSIEVFAVASESSTLTLYDNGTMIASGSGTSLTETVNITGSGSHIIEFVADNGSETDTSTFSYLVPLDLPGINPPAGSLLGINYTSASSIRLLLQAPDKEHVVVIGDFNDWELEESYQMTPSVDGEYFWLDIEGLTPGETYAFQYLVDGTIKIADPFSTLVLDPASDGFISEETFPDMHPYPIGKTTGICSVIQPDAPEFDWQHSDDFEAPAKTDLIIYELLMRDFLESRRYEDLIDTLDYLDRLGITAIQLMPVQEFEGNDSWGYNPSFHMALDKYYGTPEAFKTLVDEAHARDMAVIIDVVYNHAFSQSPLAQLYWDATNFRPTEDNPWLNVEATHPFNVGYDFNHESQATQDWVDRVMRYWLTEYRVDGFRFDLSKGFTQTNSGGNVGQWGQYDASRIALLKRIADVVWNTSNDAYVILEHFANNDEETELIEYGNGMMIWGNMNFNYSEASMGYTSNNLSGTSYTSRGWDLPHLISYMESHDEERMMYRNLEFGNSEGSYNVKDLETALQRIELVTTFFYSIPGPKMLWEFGELGYDFSINRCSDGTIDESCRLTPKPVRWDYQDDPLRLKLYNRTRGMMELKLDYDAFRTTDFDFELNGFGKNIHLNDDEMDVTVIGNFAVSQLEVVPSFQNTGTWYEYFTGDSIMVDDTEAAINLLPGEARLYTSIKLPPPPGGYQDFILDTEVVLPASFSALVYPNPSPGEFTLEYSLNQSAAVEITVFDLLGRPVQQIINQQQVAGTYAEQIGQGWSKGTYFVRYIVDGQPFTEKIVIQ